MAGHSPEEFKKHLKIYWGVFAALLVLTAVTVGVSYIHLPLFAAVLLAMVVASIKGGLVARYFMHLKGEKKVIVWTLWLTVSFFVVLMILPVLTEVESVKVMSMWSAQ